MSETFTFEEIRRKFKNGEIHSASNESLQSAVGALANEVIQNDAVKQQAVIMADAIHSVLLRRLLDEQEKRNQKTQFWFMVLAIAGIVGTLVQIGLAACS